MEAVHKRRSDELERESKRKCLDMAMKNQQTQQVTIFELPLDCLLLIISFLSSPRDLCALSRVCHYFLHILKHEEQIWESLCLYTFP